MRVRRRSWAWKRCSRCRETKAETEFGLNRSMKGGLDCYCQPCRTAIRKVDAIKHRVRENARKRRWERDHRAPCPRCGEPMRAGSAAPSARPDHCRACRVALDAERVAERDRELERLWAEGKALAEICAHFGWSSTQGGVEMVRARERGANLPYRYRTGTKNATKCPHLQRAA